MKFIASTLGFVLVCGGSVVMAGGVAGGTAGGASGTYVFHQENVLGTSLDVKMRAGSEAEADRAEAATMAAFERENGILSGWTAESEFSRWARTRGVAERVSPELFEALRLFDVWRERTGGAVDASAETAVRVWKRAAAQGREPSEGELREAVSAMQRPHWRLDAAAGTATHLDDAPIALNSFAKSFIAGHAADAALKAGANGVVLNIGGDIVIRGAMEDEVAVADPRADAENDPPMEMLRLTDRTIATSGSYRRGVEIGGAHFSHIVDPRTGETAEAVMSSTVVAREPSEAGALATAFSVMRPEESKRLAARLGDVEYMLVLRDGRRVESAGWARLEVPQFRTASLVSWRGAGQERSGSSSALRAAPMDLLITLELARIDEFRSRRPYVAVWVEDMQGKPVRTIALWSEKPRYLNELRNWYRTHPVEMRYGGQISPSVSSATRPPGKYTLRWDGKGDDGKMVAPGRYVVWIEAAREHGTYQSMRQEVNFDGKTPAKFDLPGGTEIAGASLDYGRHSE